jgi:DNA polymerase I-like protein with 3'-5' exonuclease and polymerase domains
MSKIISVSYKSTSNAYTASRWLSSLPPLIACDFETAVKYTPQELALFREELETNPPKERAIYLQAALKADGLSHPSHTTLTHFSCATSEDTAFVLILDSMTMIRYLLNFLVTTPIKQIWHNASFDLRHIHYHTHKFPIDFEDTQLLTKSLLNHVETYQSSAKLKELVGFKYGPWGISSDNFDRAHRYDEEVLKYAATDAAATYYLWQHLQNHIKEHS